MGPIKPVQATQMPIFVDYTDGCTNACPIILGIVRIFRDGGE